MNVVVAEVFLRDDWAAKTSAALAKLYAKRTTASERRRLLAALPAYVPRSADAPPRAPTPYASPRTTPESPREPSTTALKRDLKRLAEISQNFIQMDREIESFVQRCTNVSEVTAELSRIDYNKIAAKLHNQIIDCADRSVNCDTLEEKFNLFAQKHVEAKALVAARCIVVARAAAADKIVFTPAQYDVFGAVGRAFSYTIRQLRLGAEATSQLSDADGRELISYLTSGKDSTARDALAMSVVEDNRELVNEAYWVGRQQAANEILDVYKSAQQKNNNDAPLTALLDEMQARTPAH